MLDSFSEIIEVMGEPLYYNIHGAPHYILKWYHDEEHIFKYFRKIACQECAKVFVVEMCDPIYHKDDTDLDGAMYGDPPRHGSGCSAGDTMSSDMIGKLTDEEIDDLLKTKNDLESADKTASSTKQTTSDDAPKKSR